MKIVELNIEVEDLDDYNSQATDDLEEFCSALEAMPGATRKPNENDEYEAQSWTFIWMPEAGKQIKWKINQLHEIGRKYFGEDADLDISTHMYIEP